MWTKKKKKKTITIGLPDGHAWADYCLGSPSSKIIKLLSLLWGGLSEMIAQIVKHEFPGG